MRRGLNPYKKAKEIPAAPDVSLCIVTHFTNDAYHAGRAEIVLLCVSSMLRGMVGKSYELLIWDNGSTPEFISMLQGLRPTVLVQSHNIGLHNAQNALAGLARGKIISMCDDDILFAPDWFKQQHKVLTTYPKVGVVSGSPQRTAFRWAVSANAKFAKSNTGVKREIGRLIPDKWERDYCLSVERDVHQHMTTTVLEQDTLIEYKGVKTWAHGHHMQFMGYRETVKKYLFQTPYYLADGRKLNIDLDAAGFLNLTTFERTAVHIGNVIDDNIREIARNMGHEVTDAGNAIPDLHRPVVSFASSGA